jgi:hypothetical protein
MGDWLEAPNTPLSTRQGLDLEPIDPPSATLSCALGESGHAHPVIAKHALTDKLVDSQECIATVLRSKQPDMFLFSGECRLKKSPHHAGYILISFWNSWRRDPESNWARRICNLWSLLEALFHAGFRGSSRRLRNRNAF